MHCLGELGQASQVEAAQQLKMQLNMSLAIEQVGGFGLAQKLLAFVTCFARNANGYFIYPFAYLVL